MVFDILTLTFIHKANIKNDLTTLKRKTLHCRFPELCAVRQQPAHGGEPKQMGRSTTGEYQPLFLHQRSPPL